MGLKLLRKISENFNQNRKTQFLKKIQRYEIVVYVILFVLFLSLNEDKPHSNMLNSLRAIIFCLIKLSEIYLRKKAKMVV